MTADLSKYDETVSTARRWATQSDRDIFTTASKVEHALVAYADALAEAEKRLAAVEALHMMTMTDALSPECSAEECGHDECPTVPTPVCRECLEP